MQKLVDRDLLFTIPLLLVILGWFAVVSSPRSALLPGICLSAVMAAVGSGVKRSSRHDLGLLLVAAHVISGGWVQVPASTWLP